MADTDADDKVDVSVFVEGELHLQSRFASPLHICIHQLAIPFLSHLHCQTTKSHCFQLAIAITSSFHYIL